MALHSCESRREAPGDCGDPGSRLATLDGFEQFTAGQSKLDLSIPVRIVECLPDPHEFQPILTRGGAVWVAKRAGGPPYPITDAEALYGRVSASSANALVVVQNRSPDKS